MTRNIDFLRRKFFIARIYSIPVFIDVKWFFVVIPLIWIVAASIPPALTSDPTTKFTLAAITVIAFFGCILLHEFGHAYSAKGEGLGVIEIVLLPFGGVAKLRHEPDSPRAEFRIAIAGPITSFAIAFAFLGLSFVSGLIQTTLLTPLFFALFLLNLLLAIFNLFPGYPLDGGRVLRSLLWKRGKDLNEATILSGKFGEVLSAVLIFFGLYLSFYRRELLAGVWAIIVGVFLFDSARKIIKVAARLENITVDQVMEVPVIVDPNRTIMQFVDTTLSLFGLDIYPVAIDRSLLGFLLLTDIRSDLPREKWKEAKVSDEMRPVTNEDIVITGTLLSHAMDILRDSETGAIAVLDEKGMLVGMLRRGKIRTRSDG